VKNVGTRARRWQTLRSLTRPLSDSWILFEWLLTYPAVVQTASHGADVVWPVAFTKSPLVRADTVRPAETDPKGGVYMYRTVVAATLTLLFVVVGFALFVPVAASAPCNDDIPCPPPPCNDDIPCPPTEGSLCHNIGGPRDLGANCDGTGNCSFTLVGGGTINVLAGQFLGITIGAPKSAQALAAHIAHGDGPVLMTFNNLHLASTGQNHQAANVDCLGQRVFSQPPERGN